MLVDPFLGFVSTPPEHRWRLGEAFWERTGRFQGGNRG